MRATINQDGLNDGYLWIILSRDQDDSLFYEEKDGIAIKNDATNEFLATKGDDEWVGSPQYLISAVKSTSPDTVSYLLQPAYVDNLYGNYKICLLDGNNLTKIKAEAALSIYDIATSSGDFPMASKDALFHAFASGVIQDNEHPDIFISDLDEISKGAKVDIPSPPKPMEKEEKSNVEKTSEPPLKPKDTTVPNLEDIISNITKQTPPIVTPEPPVQQSKSPDQKPTSPAQPEKPAPKNENSTPQSENSVHQPVPPIPQTIPTPTQNQTDHSGKSKKNIIIAAIVAIALLIGGGVAYWITTPPPPPPPPVTGPSPDMDPNKSESKLEITGPQVKKNVDEFFANKTRDPDSAMKLAKKCSSETKEQQDALFRLYQYASNKGNSEATLRVAECVDPTTKQWGTIFKDAVEAWELYGKIPEGKQKRETLKKWVEEKAAQGDSKAKQWAEKMK